MWWWVRLEPKRQRSVSATEVSLKAVIACLRMLVLCSTLWFVFVFLLDAWFIEKIFVLKCVLRIPGEDFYLYLNFILF